MFRIDIKTLIKERSIMKRSLVELTVCFPFNGDNILLGRKKLRLGAGRYNGFGGHVEKRELIKKAAERETKEETGVDIPIKVWKVGVVDFEFQNNPGSLRRVHFFRCENFNTDPIETDEMEPRWFPIDEIPYEEMWPSDAFLLPMLIKSNKFVGKMLYDQPSTKEYSSVIVKNTIREVKTLWLFDVLDTLKRIFSWR